MTKLDSEIIIEFGQSFLVQILYFISTIFAFGVGIFLVNLVNVSGIMETSNYLSFDFVIFLIAIFLCGTQGARFFEYGSKLMHDNKDIRFIHVSNKSLKFPKSYKADTLTELGWQEIKNIDVKSVHTGLDRLFFIKSGRKLTIETETTKYRILQNDLADASDFKQLSEAVASQIGCSFKYN